MNPKAFQYQKLLEVKSGKFVHSIDSEENDIYSKREANIAGGLSIIFNRFSKRKATAIGGGKTFKEIIGRVE
ncbi:uncharacterized protein PITG_12244 [Phytophthora infestans T30-4]|uniref:Uncharacterized protein n=1 Tax=Phytophthora infestans (strain T30-4) TaxID=403677 RepID=D0NJE2_PHYIT|nr:uncharacterized protein PITG_12244 [Phytophthora infestans T30-4]EEY59660.1 hypothetical protein PITG_12244 [Phytophthora infestans T30-4]|eukprot:XP_002900853.1 hypothetical protein PITG_12244 [Phytophthora infestans T30-4]